VADLPENRWQSIHEWDHWGTVLLWDCQQDYKSPLVKCLCGKERGGISAAEVNDCIKQLFGGEVERCSWSDGGGGSGEPPPGGGGGPGDEFISDEECLDLCCAACQKKLLEDLNRPELIYMCWGYCAAFIQNDSRTADECIQEGKSIATSLDKQYRRGVFPP